MAHPMQATALHAHHPLPGNASNCQVLEACPLEARARTALACSTSYGASFPGSSPSGCRGGLCRSTRSWHASPTLNLAMPSTLAEHMAGSRAETPVSCQAIAGPDRLAEGTEGADDSLLAHEMEVGVSGTPAGTAQAASGSREVSDALPREVAQETVPAGDSANGATLGVHLEDAAGGGGKHVKAAWDALKRWARVWQLNNKGSDKDVLHSTKKVAVLGGGSFGTAMAVMLARNKADLDVVLLVRNADVAEAITNEHRNAKYFPQHRLPENVRATTSAAEALSGAQFCIHAIPVQQSAAFLANIAHHVPPSLPILSVSKGLEVTTLETMAELIPRALGNRNQPVAVLSGPSFSVELMDRKPTAIVAASKDPELPRACQQLLASRYLRVNTTSDVIGVELAGALKNVLAIAAGIVEGMGLGNNCMAALVAQGCSEIRWLAIKMGAKPTTLAGLAGTGDIMLTCFVNLSRNRSVGVRLGKGETLEQIMGTMSQVAEGVATAEAVIILARKYRVSMPVLTAVARILQNQLTPKKAVLELMSLPQVAEV